MALKTTLDFTKAQRQQYIRELQADANYCLQLANEQVSAGNLEQAQNYIQQAKVLLHNIKIEQD